MKLLKNLLAYLFFGLVISVGFKEVDLVSSSFASNFDLHKKNALLRSVKIESLSSVWSGLIYSKNSDGFLVLTIIHEEAMRELTSSAFPFVLVTLEGGEHHLASVVAWDQCNEIAMLRLADNNKRFVPKIGLNSSELKFGEELFSFGHPVGLDLHYSEGIFSAKNNKIKDCNDSNVMIADGTNLNVWPGMTGSGLYSQNGELVGLIVATSADLLYAQNEHGEVVAVTKVPIPFLGLYIPYTAIDNFLKEHQLY